MSNDIYIDTKEEFDKALKKIKDEDLVRKETEATENPYTNANESKSSNETMRRFVFKKKNSTDIKDDIYFVYAEKKKRYRICST